MKNVNENISVTGKLSRRSFIKQSAAATAVGVLASTGVSRAFAAGSDTLKVGLIGCGGRGIGAAMNCVTAAPGVVLTALGDVFSDRVENAYNRLTTNSGEDWSSPSPWIYADRVKATPETCFVGFDAYQKVIDSGVDIVLLAEPPYFRPAHLKAAIEAGKHVFMEKPGAVDPVEARSIIESSKLAKQKGLAIAAGTQRRHQPSYVEVMKRVHDGAIGEILSGECFWNGGCTRHYGFYHPKQEGWTEMENILRNWYFHLWLSGDHILEQHVHNLDVINWAIGSPPVEAIGVGGRQWRVEPEFGNIWDHFGVCFRYPNGAIVSSTCRQIDGTQDMVSEQVVGTKGRARVRIIEGENAWRWDGPNPNAYEQTHVNFVNSIRDGNPINEGIALAEATLTGIMGRMSAYSGRTIRWNWLLNESQLDLTPDIFRSGFSLDKVPEYVAPATGHDSLV